VLATLAASRTAHAHGSLTAGYRFSFLIATCLALAAIVLVATQASSRVCQQEFARQQFETSDPNGMAAAEARRADREWPVTGDEPESGAASPA